MLWNILWMVYYTYDTNSMRDIFVITKSVPDRLSYFLVLFNNAINVMFDPSICNKRMLISMAFLYDGQCVKSMYM